MDFTFEVLKNIRGIFNKIIDSLSLEHSLVMEKEQDESKKIILNSLKGEL